MCGTTPKMITQVTTAFITFNNTVHRTNIPLFGRKIRRAKISEDWFSSQHPSVELQTWNYSNTKTSTKCWNLRIGLFPLHPQNRKRSQQLFLPSWRFVTAKRYRHKGDEKYKFQNIKDMLNTIEQSNRYSKS